MAVRQRETQGKVADHCIFMVPHPGEDGSEAT